MINRRTQPLAVWFAVCDLAVTALAWVGAYLLRFVGWIPVVKDPPTFEQCLSHLPLLETTFTIRLSELEKPGRLLSGTSDLAELDQATNGARPNEPQIGRRHNRRELQR